MKCDRFIGSGISSSRTHHNKDTSYSAPRICRASEIVKTRDIRLTQRPRHFSINCGSKLDTSILHDPLKNTTSIVSERNVCASSNISTNIINNKQNRKQECVEAIADGIIITRVCFGIKFNYNLNDVYL